MKLVIGDTVKQTVTDAEQMASLTVYKLGEVLTGAKVTDDGVSFVYTEQKQRARFTTFMLQRTLYPQTEQSSTKKMHWLKPDSPPGMTEVPHWIIYIWENMW